MIAKCQGSTSAEDMSTKTSSRESSSDSNGSRTSPSKRSRRIGHAKSKNGCSTCKIRKVKCDETRPHCHQCIKSGRKCDGPVALQFRFINDQPTRQSTSPVSTEVSLLVPQHSKDERHAFHYFMTRGGALTAGTVDAEFWEALVFPLSQTYPFVWDIVVSLGALLEHVPYKFLTTTSTKVVNRAHQQALNLYNRAILNVRQMAERGQIDDSVVVMSYVLFASVEFQQRNIKGATDLMKKISKLLTDNLTSSVGKQGSIFGQAVREVVTPFILRKTVLVATLGDYPPFRSVDHDNIGEILSRYPDYYAARVQLYQLIHDSYEVIRLADFAPNVGDDDPVKVIVMRQRKSLLNQLMQWKASFMAISSDRTSDPEIDWIASYLLMNCVVCYTHLATCESLLQTIFDNHMDQFAEIIEYARTYLLHSAKSTNRQLRSSFDPGVIPALYFCARRCRDPILRRQALSLMGQAPEQERENLWAFVAPDRVAAKLITVEEGGSQLESQYADIPLPPEERRCAYVSVVSRLAPGGKQRRALQMTRFRFPGDGSRRLVHDYTWLDDDH